MRIVSYALVVVGILLLASAGYDEFRGSTRAPTGRYSHAHYTITKKDRPEEFHNAMAYHWIYGSMILIAGFIAYAIDKGQDRADPMSADSDDRIDDELRRDELDEEKRTEKEQRQRPKL
jgi:hypothetical protein